MPRVFLDQDPVRITSVKKGSRSRSFSDHLIKQDLYQGPCQITFKKRIQIKILFRSPPKIGSRSRSFSDHLQKKDLDQDPSQITSKKKDLDQDPCQITYEVRIYYLDQDPFQIISEKRIQIKITDQRIFDLDEVLIEVYQITSSLSKHPN